MDMEANMGLLKDMAVGFLGGMGGSTQSTQQTNPYSTGITGSSGIMTPEVAAQIQQSGIPPEILEAYYGIKNQGKPTAMNMVGNKLIKLLPLYQQYKAMQNREG
jgi:hypothetical protein